MATDAPPKKKQTTFKQWRWARRTVQTLFLLAFLYLLVSTVQGATGRLPNDLFFFLDPLTGITSMLASRSWIAPMALGAITLVLAVAAGRAWCGWVCPLGTILDWTPSHHNSENPAISPRWSQTKYLLLFVVIIGAILGSLTLMILDPITLLFRTLASVILPGLDWAMGGMQSWLYSFGPLRPAVEWVDGALRSWLLNDQPFYLPNMVLLAVFVAVLGLNVVRSRFWCRYLCPLGGLLGLISKVSFIRYRVDGEKCISCRKCSTLCPTGAIKPQSNFSADIAECTVCLNCMEGCPTKAISFGKERKVVQPLDTTRRWLLYSLGTAVVVAALLRFFPAAARTTLGFVRPPGSSEASLYNRCIRCGECMKICPTGVIQPSPTGSQAKLWTPVLKTRLGYCDYSCNSCGIICPTDAITNLTLEEKRKVVIGVARIDQTRCITWAEDLDCIVCEEMCPVPEKAIRLGGGGQGRGSGERQGRGSGGGRHPQVIEELCIGCGICEHQCPVAGESAIRVFPPATTPENFSPPYSE
ncbi:4Fe-4S binding protein [Chloroflexota bacterium]